MAGTSNGIGRSAIIYTHSMISGSMTFIKSHAEALRSYTPVYAGAHRVDGLPLPQDRLYVVNDGSVTGRLKEYLFRELGYAPSFIEDLRSTQPAIVHTHFGTAGPSGMVLADKLRIPSVVTFHGKDATMSQEELRSSRRGRRLIRDKAALIDRTDLFIAVSTHVRRCLLKQGYPEKKVVVHRNGIDLDYFKPPANVARSAVVLFVGRFMEKKGAEYLIEAAAQIANAGHQFDLVMLGDGPLRTRLERLAHQANINCSFPGFLPLAEVREWIGRAAVVAVPSVVASDGDSEGLPTILLEAQAMKTPVVATHHSGIPEGVQDGVTAELVTERDVDALADRILSFLVSPDKVRKFGEAGRQFMISDFDLYKQVAGLEEIYSNLHEQAVRRTE